MKLALLLICKCILLATAIRQDVGQMVDDDLSQLTNPFATIGRYAAMYTEAAKAAVKPFPKASQPQCIQYLYMRCSTIWDRKESDAKRLCGALDLLYATRAADVADAHRVYEEMGSLDLAVFEKAYEFLGHLVTAMSKVKIDVRQVSPILEGVWDDYKAPVSKVANLGPSFYKHTGAWMPQCLDEKSDYFCEDQRNKIRILEYILSAAAIIYEPDNMGKCS